MSSFLQSMALPFLGCLVLTGIHVYLGIHVLSRKVIFVDLALAQVAALGSVWGMLLGWDRATDPWTVKGFSLAFTFIGAAVFSMTRMRHERVPHEALIGITYAVALAATILFSSHLAHGAEEVSDLLAGNILWVRGDLILFTTILYAAVGTVHWLFRRQFFLISLHPDQAEAQGISVRFWDFIFYVTFGFVVTSSVSIAGVLLVFSFLVIPAVIAILFVDGLRPRLVVGWAVGTAVSAIGCSLSYFRDLPSGPTIVVSFGVSLLLAGLVRYVFQSPARMTAIARVAGGAVVFALLFGGSLLLRKGEHRDVVRLLATGSPAERMMALAEAETDPALWKRARPAAGTLLRTGETEVRVRILDLVERLRDREMLGDVHPLLLDPSDTIRERALRCLRSVGAVESRDPILAAAEKEEDEYIKVEMAEALLELGDPRGFEPIIEVIESGEVAQARRDAWEHLKAHAHVEIPYRADLARTENAKAIADLRQWWKENEKKLSMDASGVYRDSTSTNPPRPSGSR
jgi:zinc/manganese transport system permease protein